MQGLSQSLSSINLTYSPVLWLRSCRQIFTQRLHNLARLAPLFLLIFSHRLNIGGTHLPMAHLTSARQINRRWRINEAICTPVWTVLHDFSKHSATLCPPPIYLHPPVPAAKLMYQLLGSIRRCFHKPVAAPLLAICTKALRRLPVAFSRRRLVYT